MSALIDDLRGFGSLSSLFEEKLRLERSVANHERREHPKYAV